MCCFVVGSALNWTSWQHWSGGSGGSPGVPAWCCCLYPSIYGDTDAGAVHQFKTALHRRNDETLPVGVGKEQMKSTDGRKGRVQDVELFKGAKRWEMVVVEWLTRSD